MQAPRVTPFSRSALFRPRGEHAGEVQPVELFFDLVYALAVTQLTDHLLTTLSWRGALETLALLWGVWSGWICVTWISNYFDVRDRLVRLIVLGAAFVGLVLASAIPDAFEDRGMTFALAVTHPEALAAAFPISGLLPPSLYPSAALSSRPRPATLPSVAAFHGASDLAVPTRSARASIAELRRAGYTAELREYAGVEHDISDEEQGEIWERIGQAADGLTARPTPGW